MVIYLILVAYILFLPIIVNLLCKDKTKRHNATALLSVLGIYLVLALKKYTVGIDIAGYRQQYILSSRKAWEDVDYVYFEKGFVFLQKLFSKSGASFQLFTIFIYLVICIGLFLFIKKYSKNATLSSLIFICYQFFLFNITGLRQSMAMGICLIAFVVLDAPQNSLRKIRIFRIAVSLVLILLAVTIHRSAALFLVVPIIYLINQRLKRTPYLLYLFLLLLSWAARPLVYSIIEFIFEDSTDSVVTLGGNFIFLILLTAFIAFSTSLKKPYVPSSDIIEDDEAAIRDRLFLLLTLVSLPIYIILSGSTFLRASMYFSLFFIVALPNATKKWRPFEKTLIELLLIVFFVLFFYFDALEPAKFDICPYTFFWK